jgi:TonB family protein
MQVHLPQPVLAMLATQSVTKLQAMVKICISTSGEVSSVDLLKRTGYAEADANLEREIRNWKFRPYQVNGQAIPACAPYMFNYEISR